MPRLADKPVVPKRLSKDEKDKLWAYRAWKDSKMRTLADEEDFLSLKAKRKERKEHSPGIQGTYRQLETKT